MKLMDRVKFQRPETGEICEALLAWDTGEVQFLHTWLEVGGKRVGPMMVEVADKTRTEFFAGSQITIWTKRPRTCFAHSKNWLPMSTSWTETKAIIQKYERWISEES